MKKYIQKCLALVAVALLLVLSSCGKNADQNDLGDLYEAISQYRDMLTTEDSSEDNTKTSTQEIDYVLVIPAGCGAELFDSAAFLSGELSKYVADEVEVAYDCDLIRADGKIEILVGDTDRAESKKLLKGLRVDDYGYRYDNGVIAIGAHLESRCVEAVQSFLSDLESGKVDLSRTEDIQESIVRGQYSINVIKLNGFELCEYDIVYPSANKLSERALAERLRDDIAKYCGYYLRVISENECTDATRAICVGQSSKTDDYSDSLGFYLSVNGEGHIELVSNENLGIYRATQSFLDIIKQSEREGDCTLELSGKKQYFYNNDAVSLYIVRNDFGAGALDSYLSAIRGAQGASVAVFDRMSDDVRRNLTSNLQNIYSVGDSLVCYNVDDFECVSSKITEIDLGASVVTLVMKRSDGLQVGLVCGFCEDGSSAANDESFYNALITECQSLGDLPIVVIHELGSALDKRFTDENTYLVPLVNAEGIYYTSNYLKPQNHACEQIASSVFADVLDFEFYYS